MRAPKEQTDAPQERVAHQSVQPSETLRIFREFLKKGRRLPNARSLRYSTALVGVAGLELAATVGVFPAVGFSPNHETTVNSKYQLTVVTIATSAAAQAVSARRVLSLRTIGWWGVWQQPRVGLRPAR